MSEYDEQLNIDNTSGIESDSTAEEPVVEPVVTPEPVVVEKPYVSFFKQYLDYSFANKTDLAIKSLNNAIKAVFRENTSIAFKELYTLFDTNKDKIHINNRLRSIATLPKTDRYTVETFMTLFNIMSTTGKKSSIDLDKVRTVIKNNNFINWCSTKLK